MDAETNLPIYVVDAFTDRVFRGNPAAVCLYETWLDDETLQAVAAENNLSETAFLVPSGEDWELRWMTPTTEVDLCGHATLASAYVLFHEVEPKLETVRFHTKSGELVVTRDGDRIVLDFPARPAEPCDAPPGLKWALDAEPSAVLRSSHDVMAVFEREEQVAALRPSMDQLLEMADQGVIVTAPGDEVDFVSRFFAPAVGVPEDPVTGAAHCTLTPYWAQRLGKQRMEARQISARGGSLSVEDRGERVRIGGHAVLVMRGEILL